MDIQYGTNQPITAEAFAELCRNSGLRRPIDDLARIQRMLDNANLLLTAWDGDLLIGFAKVENGWIIVREA